MVSDKKEFTLISVSDPDDGIGQDDLVIQAGSVPATRKSGGDRPATRPKPGPDAPARPARASLHSGDPADRVALQQHGETSLEDLESSKMGGLQKAIVAIAAVALVAFAVYYICFM
ncbi:MAG: hypothetical protein U0L71_00735 [Eggerthellaceae bacterium]|nr:hypothetical protein [Eggerthellaceae bacterium]